MVLLFAFGLVASGLIGLYTYWAILIKKRSVNLESAALLLAIALVATGSSEFVREGMRKPYLIWGHLYSNGLLVRQVEPLATSRQSVLTYARWAVQPGDVPAALPRMYDEAFYGLSQEYLDALGETEPARIVRGRWLYQAQCLRCHSRDGYNAMRPLVHRWSPTLINQTLLRLDEVKQFMPPFVGTIQDREDLTSYLHGLNGPCTACHLGMDDEGQLAPGYAAPELKENWQEVRP
jgi:mono/diheme cytochrome c family protein